MAGAGWCTHPKRQLSSDVRILVRPAELACRNAWGVDMWMDKDGIAPDAPAAVDQPTAAPAPEVPAPTPVAQVSFDDEITSVVSSEIHRSLTDQDLNDRLVEQTTILPEERLSSHEADDRFHLLARGGRDSVGQARQRHLRRRQADAPILGGDDNPQTEESGSTLETSATSGFTPDDYVEQETPASKAVEEEPEEPDQPDEDVLLSQDSRPGSPRSRRLRRSRELPQSPKFGTGVAMELDAHALTDLPETGVRDTSDSEAMSQSSTDIDPLPPRCESSPSDTEQPGTGEVEHMLSHGTEENAYDHVMKRTQGIRAAARVEREERVRHEQRRTVAPLGMDDRVERPSTRLGAPIARRVPAGGEDLPLKKAFQENKEPATLLPDPAVEDRGHVRQRPTAHEYQSGARKANDDRRTSTERWSPTSHRQEARSSWWRGLFNRSDRSTTDDTEGWEESIDEPYLSSASKDWETGETDSWLNEHESQAAAQYEFPPNASTDEDGERNAAAYEDDPGPTSGRVGAEYERLDLQNEGDMVAFRQRLFTSHCEPGASGVATHTEEPVARAPVALSRQRPAPAEPTPPQNPANGFVKQPMRGAGQGGFRETQHDQELIRGRVSDQFVTRRRSGYQPQREPERASTNVLPVNSLLGAPADEGFEPEVTPEFDIRAIVEQRTELLDMAITIAPDVPRECSTCRSYRMSEQGERGWCTNNWAFTHRQMVNATDLACQSTIGCWWLPADEEVGLITDESGYVATPRVDRLIAQLDPLKRAVGR
ncbi:MAG TPA: hypothetical protein VGR29_07285 [Thermomicrobiales bacterium]|nr:hypothetical protein [Thermomicrobiales bacterium]